MIVKRILAVLAAIGLIAGAWVIRDQVIEGDDAEATGDTTPRTLVCVTELAAICREVAGADLDVIEQAAGDTLDQLSRPDAEPVLWLTFEGFPEMVARNREFNRAEPIATTSTRLASSPIAAVVQPAATAALVQACGDPVDLGCLVGQTELTAAVSSIDSGIGLLTIASAFRSEGGPAMVLDDMLPWARGFRREADSVQLSGRTAIGTLQTRTSIGDAALGVEAELSSTRRDAFDVLYAEPMVRVRAVLMVPDGVSTPRGLTDGLAQELLAGGWGDADLPDDDTARTTPDQVLAVRAYWKDQL